MKNAIYNNIVFSVFAASPSPRERPRIRKPLIPVWETRKNIYLSENLRKIKPAKNPKPLDDKGKDTKSLFSDRPDPSVHIQRIKRYIRGGYDVRAPYIKKHRKYLKKISDAEKAAKKAFKKVADMEQKRRRDIVAEARDIQDIARQYSPRAMQALADILDNPDAADTAKIAAANVILDRAHGKPAATNFNVNANVNANPKDLDSRDLDQRIEDTIARVNNLTERASEEVESEKRPINLREYN